jgi:hypothetical protein
MLCDRNKPFGEISPLANMPEGRRQFGLAKGKIHLPDDFNEPDHQIEEMFYGPESICDTPEEQ